MIKNSSLREYLNEHNDPKINLYLKMSINSLSKKVSLDLTNDTITEADIIAINNYKNQPELLQTLKYMNEEPKCFRDHIMRNFYLF